MDVDRSPLPHVALARPAAIAALVALSLGLASCDLSLRRTDLASFIDTGLATVIMRSTAFDVGSGSLSRVPSGKTVTCNLVLVNPKSFDITYSLVWNADSALFTTAPPVAPVPKDATHVAFSFALDPARAEHETIAFSLRLYVAALNKTYDPIEFSVICDSPPNPAQRVASMMDSGQKSILAILLPTATSDDDLSKIRIDWSMEGSTAVNTATYDIAALSALPSSNPFATTYDCYFQGSDCVAGYGYAYTVTLIDAAGQESGPVSTSSTANVFYVNYDGNGNTSGTPPASTGYRYNTSATVASTGDLAKSSYAFAGWNTARDGTGTTYWPGNALIVPAGEVTLYAQWVTNATTITFDVGTQGLSFSASATSVALGGTVAVSCGNAALTVGGSSWKWYVDGVEQGVHGSSFSWTPTGSGSIGQHIVGCSVTYNSIGYSGSFRATVTQ